MKKVLFSVLVLVGILGFTTIVSADPGPYGPLMTGDACDPSPDGVATPCDSGVPGTPQVYQALNQIFVNAGLASPGYASNGDADSIQVVSANDYWNNIVGGNAGNFAAVGITAANLNTLGVYLFGAPGIITNTIPPQTGFGYLGDGSNANPYPGGINPYASGENFGFALTTVDPNNVSTIWYSDPSLNSDGFDHMLAYYLPQLDGVTVWIDTNGSDAGGLQQITFSVDTYLLAFEDQNLNTSDSDYNDTLFLVTRVRPVPEPASMLLLGSGLMGLVGLRRKKA